MPNNNNNKNNSNKMNAKLHGIGKPFGKDPLNKIVLVLIVLLLASAAIVLRMGYAYTVSAVWALLFFLAYVKAPARKFPTAEKVSEGQDWTGKVAIVTGPTSGIGTETARTLALRGAHVILAARTSSKNEATKAMIEKSVARAGKKATVTCLTLDLADLDSIQAFAASFRALKLPSNNALHFLVNNAGVMALRDRRGTKQGIEMQVGTNHVGHFYLTQLLLPQLKAAKSARVVCLSSVAYRLATPGFFEVPAHTEGAYDILETTPYEPWIAYGNAKLSNMLFAKELHAREASNGISACSVMPGGIHTGLQGEVSPWTMFKWLVVTPFFFKSIEQGAATTMAALISEDPGGAYFNDCKKTRVATRMDREVCTSLWERTEQLLRRKGH